MTKFQMLMAELKFCAVKILFKDGSEKVVTLYQGFSHENIPQNLNEQDRITAIVVEIDDDGKAKANGKFSFYFDDVQSFCVVKKDKDNFYLDSITCYD